MTVLLRASQPTCKGLPQLQPGFKRNITRVAPSILHTRTYRSSCRHQHSFLRASSEPALVSSASGAGSNPLPDETAQQQPQQQNAPPTNKQQQQQQQQPDPPLDAVADSGTPTYIRLIHVILFVAIFTIGTLFVTMTIHFKDGTGVGPAFQSLINKLVKSLAFRQLVVIASAIILVRFGLHNFVQYASKIALLPVQFDRTKTYYFLKEVYQPLELLLFIAGMCTLADAFVPHLVTGLSKTLVNNFVRCTLAVSFIISSANIIMRIKRQFCQENAWQAEMNGDVTSQRRWEAYDKLGTFAVYVMAFVFVVQAVGLEVTSVLAIGGVGGLAVGLAGREIVENLFNGFLILTSNPFEVGDEVMFYPNSSKVEGIVTDIGWYRTLIRSFEREVYIIPNAVFSKNTVLNITRKGREWRFYEFISIRVQDVNKVSPIISDMRRIIKNDPRIINNLHKRVYLDQITLEDVKIYISFYVEAATRDIFMTYKQDFLLGFIDCIHRNNAQLAQKKLLLEVITPTTPPAITATATATTPALATAATTPDKNSNIMIATIDESTATTTAIPAAESVWPVPLPVQGGKPPNGGGGGGGVAVPGGGPGAPAVVYQASAGGLAIGGGTVMAASVVRGAQGPWWERIWSKEFWVEVAAPLYEEKLY